MFILLSCYCIIHVVKQTKIFIIALKSSPAHIQISTCACTAPYLLHLCNCMQCSPHNLNLDDLNSSCRLLQSVHKVVTRLYKVETALSQSCNHQDSNYLNLNYSSPPLERPPLMRDHPLLRDQKWSFKRRQIEGMGKCVTYAASTTD